jgi:dTDP-4-dehydrorhamnose 3,5-epimerase
MKSTFEGVVFFPLKKRHDDRGWLCELFRVDHLYPENFPKMAYVSQTEPGVKRGPHEHAMQSDYFAFIGPGNFELHLWQTSIHPVSGIPAAIIHETYQVGEDNPVAVIVPPGVVHGYRNVSDKPGWVFNGPNQLYAGPGQKHPVDEIRWEETDKYHWDD